MKKPKTYTEVQGIIEAGRKRIDFLHESPEWTHELLTVYDGSGLMVCRCSTTEQAGRIVRAVNAHKALLEAAIYASDWDPDADVPLVLIRTKLHDAIMLARGKK